MFKATNQPQSARVKAGQSTSLVSKHRGTETGGITLPSNSMAHARLTQGLKNHETARAERPQSVPSQSGSWGVGEVSLSLSHTHFLHHIPPFTTTHGSHRDNFPHQNPYLLYPNFPQQVNTIHSTLIFPQYHSYLSSHTTSFNTTHSSHHRQLPSSPPTALITDNFLLHPFPYSLHNSSHSLLASHIPL
ncbi:hypothetical protein Pcinc_011305 [Petrolisthes cinctipes]|uniref:Uncharacterized protein n=1 Tax=Petrolisthes cinctipes TaxID=88211 RepID=A0AAE1G3C3_PETCI|nr:hypothetical protein Pcinc_011305 [Petrolisthes cinctipes]